MYYYVKIQVIFLFFQILTHKRSRLVTGHQRWLDDRTGIRAGINGLPQILRSTLTKNEAFAQIKSPSNQGAKCRQEEKEELQKEGWVSSRLLDVGQLNIYRILFSYWKKKLIILWLYVSIISKPILYLLIVTHKNGLGLWIWDIFGRIWRWHLFSTNI